jgi:signal peptidase II
LNRSFSALSDSRKVENHPVAQKAKSAALPADQKLGRRYALFFAIAVFGCAADLLTKEWVFQWRGPPRPNNEWWLIDGYVGIETAVNLGALFGMGHGYSLLFAGLSIAAALGVLAWIFFGKAVRDLPLTVALGCVMGGILGNLYDRLGLWRMPGDAETRIYGVRDWVLFRVGDYTWPNFNIADSLLVCGAMLLFWHSFRASHEEGKPADGEDETATIGPRRC